MPRPPRPRRLPRARAAVLIGLACALIGLPRTGVLAASETPTTAVPAPGVPATDTPAVPDARISPLLWSVPVDSPAYRAAVARYRDTEAGLATARQTFADAQAQLGPLTDADARLVALTNDATRRRAKSAARAEALRTSAQHFAVASYVAGGPGDALGLGLDLDEVDARLREQALVDIASEQRFVELVAHTEQVRRLDETLVQADAELTDVRRRLDETTARRDGAIAEATRLLAELDRAARQVADARLEADVVGLDLRFVVLDAYVQAATVLFAEQPACALRWTALAGIGRTESGHGTFGGAVVQADGTVTRPIVGIALDGNNGTAVIGDSDGGALDGDAGGDRAVGPMQFIPTSWRAFGRDGNGDGRADPQNVYDAALAAASLLCRSGPLDSDAGLRAAFLRYNNSSAYASLVLERTHRYDAFVIPPPS